MPIDYLIVGFLWDRDSFSAAQVYEDDLSSRLHQPLKALIPFFVTENAFV